MVAPSSDTREEYRTNVRLKRQTEGEPVANVEDIGIDPTGDVISEGNKLNFRQGGGDGGGLTDAEIGAKAFRNPPADLTDAEKLADRVAIGAASLNDILDKVGIVAVERKNANYTVVAGDEDKLLLMDTAGGARTITLPAPSNGFDIWIGKGSNDTNAVTIATPGSALVDGQATYSLAANGEIVHLVSDGTNWTVVGGDLAQPDSIVQVTFNSTTEEFIFTKGDGSTIKVQANYLTSRDFEPHEDSGFVQTTGHAVDALYEIAISNADGSTYYNIQQGGGDAGWKQVIGATSGRIYISDTIGSQIDQYGQAGTPNKATPTFESGDTITFQPRGVNPSGGDVDHNAYVTLTLSSGATAFGSGDGAGKWYSWNASAGSGNMGSGNEVYLMTEHEIPKQKVYGDSITAVGALLIKLRALGTWADAMASGMAAFIEREKSKDPLVSAYTSLRTSMRDLLNPIFARLDGSNLTAVFKNDVRSPSDPYTTTTDYTRVEPLSLASDGQWALSNDPTLDGAQVQMNVQFQDADLTAMVERWFVGNEIVIGTAVFRLNSTATQVSGNQYQAGVVWIAGTLPALNSTNKIKVREDTPHRNEFWRLVFKEALSGNGGKFFKVNTGGTDVEFSDGTGSGGGGISAENVARFLGHLRGTVTRNFVNNLTNTTGEAIVSTDNTVPQGAPAGTTALVAVDLSGGTGSTQGLVGDIMVVNVGTTYILAEIRFKKNTADNTAVEYWFDPSTDSAHTLAYGLVANGEGTVEFIRPRNIEAKYVDTDASGWSGNLGTGDDTVQKALQKFNDYAPSVVTPKGDYADNTDYYVGDVVAYNTHLFYCILDVPNTNTTKPAANSTHWEQLTTDATPTATESAEGKVRLATNAEETAGTQGGAVVPNVAGVKSMIDNNAQNAAGVAVDASGFDGNLTTTDNTVQKVAQKVDDLSTGGSGGGLTAAGIAGLTERSQSEPQMTVPGVIDVPQVPVYTSSEDFVSAGDTGEHAIAQTGGYFIQVKSGSSSIWVKPVSGGSWTEKTGQLDSAITNPTSITARQSDNRLWILDNGSDHIYCYDFNTATQTVARNPSFERAAPTNSGQSIEYDQSESKLYIGEIGTTLYVLQVTATNITYSSSDNITLDSANGNPYGIAVTPNYIYTIDRLDHKGYAYTKAGVYTSAQDFNLNTANGDSQDACVFGDYIFVLDNTDNKVYAYKWNNPQLRKQEMQQPALALSDKVTATHTQANENTSNVSNTVYQDSDVLVITASRDGGDSTGGSVIQDVASLKVNAVGIIFSEAGGSAVEIKFSVATTGQNAGRLQMAKTHDTGIDVNISVWKLGYYS